MAGMCMYPSRNRIFVGRLPVNPWFIGAGQLIVRDVLGSCVVAGFPPAFNLPIFLDELTFLPPRDDPNNPTSQELAFAPDNTSNARAGVGDRLPRVPTKLALLYSARMISHLRFRRYDNPFVVFILAHLEINRQWPLASKPSPLWPRRCRNSLRRIHRPFVFQVRGVVEIIRRITGPP